MDSPLAMKPYQRLLLLLALLAVAVAGNHYNQELFFGVNIIFGSVAVWLALIWLGLRPALMVAAASGLYTYVLWDHPYAFAIFVAEAAFVGGFYQHARQRGQESPPLLWLVCLYWILVGVPLVLFFYGHMINMPPTQVVLIAIKQPLNGILNAALAQLILLGTARLRHKRLTLPLRQLLFSLLLTVMLIPVIGVIAWQNQNLRVSIEADLRDRLLWFGELASLAVLQGNQDPKSLADLEQMLAARLPTSALPSLALLPEQAQQADLVTPSEIEGLAIRLPENELPARMQQWRAARYQVSIPTSRGATEERLAIEVSATLVIDQLHERIVRLLGALLALIGISALFAERLSTLLTRPLERLIETATQLPSRITDNHSVEPMKPVPVIEIERLGRAIEQMGGRLAESFLKLQQERDALTQQRERYRLVVDNLEDLLIRTDQFGRLEFVSPSYCRLFGRCEAELIGQDIFSQRFSSDPEAGRKAMETLQQDPFMHSSENYVHTQSGWRWLQWVDRAILDHTGALRSIVSLGRDITQRKQAELDLIQREKIERELLDVATAFMLHRDEQLSTLIDQVLKRVGDFTHSDRSYLFQLHPDGMRMSNTYEWVGPGVEPMISHLQDMSVDDFSAVTQHMLSGQPVVVPRVADLSDDWAEERKILEFQGIKSVLLVPLMSSGRLSGFIGFDAVFTTRDWLATEVRFLQVVANLMVGAFDRARIHQALVDSQERYDQLARQSRSVAWEVDAQGCYTYLSPNVEDLIGYGPEQLVGKWRFYDLFPAAERERLKVETMKYIEECKPCHDLNNVICHADGSPVWVNTNGLPILDDQGALQGYRGIDIDISARHRAEQQLRDSEARLSAIFNQAPIGIAIADADGRLTLANQALEMLLGCKTKSLIGMRCDEFTHPEDKNQERKLYEQLVAGQRSQFRITKRLQKPDGKVVWGDQRVVLIPQEDGNPPLQLGMIEDITEVQLETERRKQIEQELADYRCQLEKLVDISARSLPFNQEVQSLLALGCDGLQVELGELGLIKDSIDYQRCARHVSKSAQVAEPPAFSLGHKLLSNSRAQPGIPQLIGTDQLPRRCLKVGWRSALSLVIPWNGPDGKVETLALSFWSLQPLSSLSTLGRELIRLIGQRLGSLLFKEQVQQVMIVSKERETIGHLASGIAHDFNNLLGVIDGNLQYLQASLDRLPPHPEINEFGEIIDETLSALGQATVITAGMLSLSRAGGISIKPTALEPAIDELMRILQHILPARIRLELDIEPGISADTNVAFLQSALLNLALNGRDAMPEDGRLSIRIAHRSWTQAQPLAVGQLDPGDYVELRVADTGCGMNAETLRRLFEPLFSTKAKQRGHGLGMFMVQEFVLRSGAGLAVESQPGRGTVFRLLLPPGEKTPAEQSTKARQQLPAPIEEQGHRPKQGQEHQPPQVHQRVLVVDDDPRVRETISRLLRNLDVTAEVAEDGEACLQQLSHEPGCDLVLTDLAMPKMDGAELHTAITERYPEIRVVLMSGQEETNFGFDQLSPKPLILRKPIAIEQLRQALRNNA